MYVEDVLYVEAVLYVEDVLYVENLDNDDDDDESFMVWRKFYFYFVTTFHVIYLIGSKDFENLILKEYFYLQIALFTLQ